MDDLNTFMLEVFRAILNHRQKYTPEMFAVIKKILHYGANPNQIITDHFGDKMSLLHYAALYAFHNEVELLLSAGANTNPIATVISIQVCPIQAVLVSGVMLETAKIHHKAEHKERALKIVAFLKHGYDINTPFNKNNQKGFATLLDQIAYLIHTNEDPGLIKELDKQSIANNLMSQARVIAKNQPKQITKDNVEKKAKHFIVKTDETYNWFNIFFVVSALALLFQIIYSQLIATPNNRLDAPIAAVKRRINKKPKKPEIEQKEAAQKEAEPIEINWSPDVLNCMCTELQINSDELVTLLQNSQKNLDVQVISYQLSLKLENLPSKFNTLFHQINNLRNKLENKNIVLTHYETRIEHFTQVYLQLRNQSPKTQNELDVFENAIHDMRSVKDKLSTMLQEIPKTHNVLKFKNKSSHSVSKVAKILSIIPLIPGPAKIVQPSSQVFASTSSSCSSSVTMPVNTQPKNKKTVDNILVLLKPLLGMPLTMLSNDDKIVLKFTFEALLIQLALNAPYGNLKLHRDNFRNRILYHINDDTLDSQLLPSDNEEKSNYQVADLEIKLTSLESLLKEYTIFLADKKGDFPRLEHLTGHYIDSLDFAILDFSQKNNYEIRLMNLAKMKTSGKIESCSLLNKQHIEFLRKHMLFMSLKLTNKTLSDQATNFGLSAFQRGQMNAISHPSADEFVRLPQPSGRYS